LVHHWLGTANVGPAQVIGMDILGQYVARCTRSCQGWHSARPHFRRDGCRHLGWAAVALRQTRHSNRKHRQQRTAETPGGEWHLGIRGLDATVLFSAWPTSWIRQDRTRQAGSPVVNEFQGYAILQVPAEAGGLPVEVILKEEKCFT